VDRNDAGGTRLSVAIPEFGSLENAADASALNRPALADEPSSVLPGYPQLPMVTRTILIPPTTGVRLIIHGIDSRLESDFDPFITPPQDGSVNPDLPGVPSDDYLRWVGFWPPEPIVVSEPAIVRGYRVAQVTLFPIQVNPSTGERRINENFDFELAFEGEGENVVANPSRRPTHIARNMVEGLVVNPEQIRLYRDDLPGRGCYMLLYINNNGWANALQPLIDWRKRQGWNVVAVGFNGGVSNANIKQRYTPRR